MSVGAVGCVGVNVCECQDYVEHAYVCVFMCVFASVMWASMCLCVCVCVWCVCGMCV